MTANDRISLGQQIEEIDFEIKMRKQLIEKKKATKPSEVSNMQFRLTRMEAARATLQFIKDHEEVYRKLVVQQIRDDAEKKAAEAAKGAPKESSAE